MEPLPLLAPAVTRPNAGAVCGLADATEDAGAAQAFGQLVSEQAVTGEPSVVTVPASPDVQVPVEDPTMLAHADESDAPAEEADENALMAALVPIPSQNMPLDPLPAGGQMTFSEASGQADAAPARTVAHRAADDPGDRVEGPAADASLQVGDDGGAAELTTPSRADARATPQPAAPSDEFSPRPAERQPSEHRNAAPGLPDPTRGGTTATPVTAATDAIADVLARWTGVAADYAPAVTTVGAGTPVPTVAEGAVLTTLPAASTAPVPASRRDLNESSAEMIATVPPGDAAQEAEPETAPTESLVLRSAAGATVAEQRGEGAGAAVRNRPRGRDRDLAAAGLAFAPRSPLATRNDDYVLAAMPAAPPRTDASDQTGKLSLDALPDGMFSRDFAPGPGVGRAVDTTPAPQPRPADAHAPAVARQIAAAAVSLGEGEVEVALAPEELGRIRLRVAHGAGQATVTVWFDRPDVLDAARRNAEQLMQDLRDSGIDNARLDLRGGSDHRSDRQFDDGQARDQGAESDRAEGVLAPATRAPAGAMITRSPLSDRALDIRV